MAQRLFIAVEFSKNKLEDLQLYAKLKEFSSPGSLIKDILRGKIPVDILKDIYDEIEN